MVWDELHYAGMGKRGDQSLEESQNKTLAQSGVNGVEVHLFEVFESTQYTYQGVVELSGDPYPEKQEDEDGNLRLVWMFPLRKVDKSGLSQTDYRKYIARQEKLAESLSREKLKNEAEKRSQRKKAVHRTVSSDTFIRDPYVAIYAKVRANGICQLCNMPAPFKDGKGKPYLESHHIVWLSKGGEDTIMNTVALCPNCHKRMHILNEDSAVKILQERNKEML